MEKYPAIRRPIFIVGCGRSGTTILYDLMCAHPDLAWFSNLDARWPTVPQATLLSRDVPGALLRRATRGRMPKPDEGYPLWDVCRPVDDSPCDPPLTEQDVQSGDIDRARKLIGQHLHYQGKQRFINKNTRNTRRIRYLQGLFEDALFIHIVRDPRATVNSLLHVAFWPTLRIWCEQNITPLQWEAEGREPAELAARLWTREVECALHDKDMLRPDRYFELRYEDFVASPKPLLARILDFADLEWCSDIDHAIARAGLKNMNDKYRAQLSAAQISAVEAVAGPLAAQLGYDLHDRSPDMERRTA